MDTLAELDDKLNKHASRVKEIGDEVRSLVESESTESKARLDELAREQKRITQEVAPLIEDKEKADLRESVQSTQRQLESLMAQTRTAAKAVGSGGSFRADSDPHYKAGSFLGAIVGLADRDPVVDGVVVDHRRRRR